ncbi:MAG: hypothetical protein V3U37_03895 [Nitrospinaceae bacterium]
MLEIFLILYIFFLFIFPVPAAAVFLGTVTTWAIYRKYNLFTQQPEEGRKILRLNAWTFAANFAASLFVGSGLALMVYLLIFGNVYILAFNFIFCAGISIRWFDYTHQLYRHFILKLKNGPAAVPDRSVFAVCTGLRESSGSGWGATPVFTDAGILELGESEIVFRGVFTTQQLNTKTVSRAEKKSFEKIKVFLKHSGPPAFADVLMISLKEQFYPFKSRETRDRIFLQLASPETRPVNG